MNKYIKIGLGIVATGIVIVAIGFFFQKGAILGGGAGGQYARTCTVSFSEATTTGHQLSTTILPAYGLRAWARIQIADNATNTTFVRLDEGTAATASTGIPLGAAILNGATTSPLLDFGLNTDFPYTGAVTAINDNGTSTVFITECRY